MTKKKKSSLKPYRAKRDFSASPEPAPAEKPARRGKGNPLFVIHRHDARRLHYDLRLEVDGVLKSWAIPKGFSYKPRDKHLAVQTEDHPLEYKDFHGLIPSGQYGAGIMTIWDRGTYQFANSTAENDEKLELCFFGARLRGEWHMVRLKGSKNEWLLFKSKDEYARGEDDSDLSLDLQDLVRSAMPAQEGFMRARRPRTLAADTFAQARDWWFELCLEGRRVIATKTGGQVEMKPPCDGSAIRAVTSDLKRLRAHRARIDGVLVCLDEGGRPDPQLLAAVLNKKAKSDVCLHALDLLFYEDWDLRGLPLRKRQAALSSILPPLNHVVSVQHQRYGIAELLAAASAGGFPGLVGKRAGSIYRAGISDDWIEVPGAAKRESAKKCLAALDRRKPALHGATREIKLSNQRKILWPADGFSKGDIVDYYDAVADVLLPHLCERPLSLQRYPSGIEGESFFQKDAPSHTPDWIETCPVLSEGEDVPKHYILASHRDTLIYLANLAAIEIHPWMSRAHSQDQPDWSVLDLDPFGAPWENVVKIAREIGAILRDAQIPAFLKTSGSKGLHIYVPLANGYTFQHSCTFAEAVARLVAIRLPKIATTQRARNTRVGMVYVDYLQNHRGQTVAAPYVVRPVPGGCVSAPLRWEELSGDLRPTDFTIETMPYRIAENGDLFAEVLSAGVELTGAIERICQVVDARSGPRR